MGWTWGKRRGGGSWWKVLDGVNWRVRMLIRD